MSGSLDLGALIPGGFPSSVQSVFIREVCEVRHEFVETAFREVPLIFDLVDLVLPQIKELLR